MDPRYPFTLEVVATNGTKSTLPDLNSVIVDRLENGKIALTTEGRFEGSNRSEDLSAEKIQSFTITVRQMRPEFDEQNVDHDYDPSNMAIPFAENH